MTTTTTTTIEQVSSTSLVGDVPLRCIVCRRPFNFAAGETAYVLHHIACYYDFVHDGACLATALEWIFVEPGYDRPAFTVGTERVRIIRADPADGWAVVYRGPNDVTGSSIRVEAVRSWAVIEDGDGSCRVEGIVRDTDWEHEPGGAEFPEARQAWHTSGYYVFLGNSISPAERRIASITKPTACHSSR